MDQDSTKDPDKRNWRERLGIGKQELPRISDEFKADTKSADQTATSSADVPSVPAPGSARPAPRVVKPAPMAPHVSKPEVAPPAAASPASDAPKPVAPRPPAEPRRSPAPDPLADKLRAQRAAAERLAEQRVQAARARAEAVRRQAPTPPVPPRGPSIIAEAQGGPRPKYSFADDDPQRPVPPARPAFPPGQFPQAQNPQLAPPRPPLGGSYPPQQPPYGAGMQRPQPPIPPGYRPQPPQPPQGFRPIDPATGYPMQPGYMPPGVGRPYPGQAGTQPGRMPMPPRPDAAPYVPAYPGGQRVAPPPSQRRPQRQVAPPPASDAELGEDIFEQPPRAPAPRASATDYNQAYQEMEDGYVDEPRRSAGPWVLLLLLMLAAAVAGAGVWFYQTSIKSAGKSSAGNVPVVEAPAEPAKTVTEPAPDSTTAPGTPTRKAIYDRIVGDQEVLGGQMAPTEETPVQPQGQSQPIPDPTGDSPPLPLPPPPGGDGAVSPQGALEGTSTTSTAMTAAPTPAADGAPGSTMTAGTTGSVPAADQGQASPLPDQLASTGQEQISDPGSTPAEPAATAAKPASAKKTATAKPETVKPEAAKPKAEPYNKLGSKPVVLVPPSKPAKTTTATAETSLYGSAPAVPAESVSANQNPALAMNPSQQAPATTPKKKGGGLLDLFNGNRNAAAPATTPEPAQPQTQVASLPPAQPAQPAPVTTKTPPLTTATAPTATTGAGGFVVQLASYRSQAEASTETGKYRSRHSALLGGLTPIITEANVNGSTRYRLAFGTLPSRNDASRLCSQLFAAGERDCLVRNK